MVNSKCYLINTMEKSNERGLMKREKVPKDILAEIRNEVFLSIEHCMSRLSKKYSTKEYDVLITFDSRGINAEKAYL